MKEITKTLYTFKELLRNAEIHPRIWTAAVEKVRGQLREWITDGDWHDYTVELWTNALNQVGFENATIAFSGFSCQGDGASFSADIDTKKILKFLTSTIKPNNCIKANKKGEEQFLPWVVHKLGWAILKPNPEFHKLKRHCDAIELKVERTDSHYSHENTCDIRGEFYGPEKLSDTYNQFEKNVESLRYDLCKAIYNSLEDDYHAQTEDEALIDFSEANEYHWDDKGRME